MKTRTGITAAAFAFMLLVVAASLIVMRNIRIDDSPVSELALQQQATPTPEETKSTSTPVPQTTPAYPPPYSMPTSATPSLTRTPDPTRVAMTAQQWAELVVDRMTDADAQNPFFQGPFSIIDAVDVYPGDIMEVSSQQITRGTSPDVALILSGQFRSSRSRASSITDTPGPDFEYMLMVGDRTAGNGYFVAYSNDVSTLQSMLP